MPLRRRMAILALVTLALGASWAQATSTSADFPKHPVRIIVPYAPGGITDNVARLLGQKLQDRWGQTVVVENKPGASGAIAAGFVANAPPDGHTLMVSITSMLQAPILDTQLRFDIERDFAPVAQLATSPLVLVVANGMGVQTLPAFMAALKAAPEKYSYGSVGAGSTLHLYGDQLARRWGVQPLHVAFKGASPLVIELLADRINFAFLDFLTVRQHIESGKLKAIAVTGTKRAPLFPAVPTLAESGIAGFEVTSWVAMFAPKATPAPLVARISADLAQVLKQPEVVTRFGDAGLEASPLGPEDFGRRVSTDRQLWHRLIVEAKAANPEVKQ